MSSSAVQQSQTSFLLRLPAEITTSIYKRVLPAGFTFHIEAENGKARTISKPDSAPNLLAILHVCNQVYKETAFLLYRHNHFRIYSHPASGTFNNAILFIEALTGQTRKCIESLAVVGLQPCSQAGDLVLRDAGFQRKAYNYRDSENWFYHHTLGCLEKLEDLTLGFDLSQLGPDWDNPQDYTPNTSWLARFLHRSSLTHITIELDDRSWWGEIPASHERMPPQDLVDALNSIDGGARIKALCCGADDFVPAEDCCVDVEDDLLDDSDILDILASELEELEDEEGDDGE